ncbi:MAG TPA: DUF2306 domain-containing protein [Thermoanaerobaculia bacterium]|nr:DUF2306 domain-containing protein [Thermoanaerobaculia bacterium]
MSTAVWTERWERTTSADTLLRAAARFWFGVTILGQFVFAFAVASFYGMTALRGDYHRWAKFINHGHVPGDTMGNLSIALHVGSAVALMLAGGLQIVPGVRNRFPRFHRWNGRVYVLAAVTVSVAGLYMTWIRGGIGDVSQHLGSTLNAVLIWLCAGMALRFAIARDFRTHRRWALRLFLVASAAFFYRATFFFTMLVFGGPVGFDPTTFSGPFLTFMAFAQALVPLGILELYLRAQARPGAFRRLAVAALLFILTLGMAGGLLAITRAVWVPDVKAAFDSRTSIAETVSATIASQGLDAAVEQYRRLKASSPATYNFDEGELNSLGYEFLREKKLPEAIRVFQLNVEAYPRKSNVYDSLAEAYGTAGDRPQAIANYRKAIELDPNNRNSIVALGKLEASSEEARQ